MTTQPAPRLTRLLEAVLEVGTDLDLRSTLQHVVDGAAELTGASWAALTTADPARDGLAEIRTPDRGDLPERGPRLRVPVLVRDEEFGELLLAGRPGGAPFTAEDEELLRVLATQAGIAIGNVRLYEAAGSASGGSRAPPPSPTRCSPGRARTTRWRRSPNGPGCSPAPVRA